MTFYGEQYFCPEGHYLFRRNCSYNAIFGKALLFKAYCEECDLQYSGSDIQVDSYPEPRE